MKFKLDDNFGKRTREIFLEYNCDVEIVSQQNIQGTSDHNLFKICCEEEMLGYLDNKESFYAILRFL
jgi:hypothetical protein